MRARLFAVALVASSLSAADWTSGGPRGGAFQSLASAPSNPRVVYAGGTSGVFRTDDNGDTWRDVSHGVSAVSRIAVDPNDPDTAYAIGGGGPAVAASIYRTANGGASWSAMDVGLIRPNTILVDPNNSQTLYASGDCGVIFKTQIPNTGVRKSTDGGTTWRDATEGFKLGTWAGCVLSMGMDPADSAHLFAFSDAGGGYWETLDGAATWTQPAGPVPSRNIVAHPRLPLVQYGTDGRQWLISNDGGAHWTPLATAGLPASLSSAPLSDLAIDPSVPRLFSATVAGLYRSGNGGASWIPAGDAPAIDVNAVVFTPLDSTVMIATTQGIFRAPSPAFTPWAQLDVPESGIEISEVATDPHRSSVVYAASHDALASEGRIFRSRDAGANWELLDGRNVFLARMAVDANGDLWFAGIRAPALQRVPEGTSEVETIAQQFGQIVAVATPPDAPGRVYVAGDVIWRTDDSGRSWQRCLAGGPFLDMAAAQPDIVWATKISGLIKSTDGCATFQVLPMRGVASLVAPAPSDPAVVYIYLYRDAVQTVWRTDDGGTAWNSAALPFRGDVTKIAVDPHHALSVWVSTQNHGVWHSDDGGATWSNLSEGLPSGNATAIAVGAGGTTVHAGLSRAGVWELRIAHGRGRAAGRGN